MLAFSKFSGSGNDFIIVDNRGGEVQRLGLEPSELVRRLCRQHFSVGADGMILIEDDPEPGIDFAWRFFNADGSEVEMCGNGGRCAARFAQMHGIAGDKMSFRTRAGVVRAEVLEGGRAKIELGSPRDLLLDYPLDVNGQRFTVSSVNTGVPHVVTLLPGVDALEEADIIGLGRAIRHHERYSPAGTNANFAAVDGEGKVFVRTYERGVEDETLACGTGSVATAIVLAAKGLATPPLGVSTKGGEVLRVHLTRDGDVFRDVFLEGGASLIYEGVLSPEAYA